MTTTPGQLLEQCAEELNLALNSHKLSFFLSLLSELKKWNSKVNLTSIREDEQIVLKHFIDSLMLIPAVHPQGRLLDIGSGGGFPGLPLKIMLPALEVVSVDAVEKKILFQRHIARILDLRKFSALHARVEHLPEKYHGCFDWIVTRAFSDLTAFAALGLPYLKPNGCMIAMKGRRGGEEAEDAENPLEELGVRIDSCIGLKLPVSGDDRCLVVMHKTTGKPTGIYSGC
ncbi:MAG: 16S rRNA (guanine(527)-N(7))-methyltransferase RsmG [Geobacteraceae bacterium]|nr:16S rRNA (guanine(527)-N(7))-methyltransferase RsmG [Geobacteraceae bacterium]